VAQTDSIDLQTRDAFASVPGLAELSDADRRRFEEKSVRLRIPRGTVLVRQGEPANELYIVLAGRFVVTLDERPGIIAEIGPGEPIGELAFFGSGTRTATVTAARDSDVVMLTREAYAEVMRQAPSMLAGILSSVASRLAAVTPASPVLRGRPARTVAILPVGASGLLPPGFIERLTRALLPRSVVVVSRETLPALGADKETELGDFLLTVEKSADVVLFALDQIDAETAQHCLHVADDLLLVASEPGGHAPSVGISDIEREASALFSPEHRTLIVCRKSSNIPISGTERWLAGRDLALHHHVALDSQADFDRLARFLSGSAIGLVLSGGGVLGCAHLGVAKAIRDAGISIDFVGGTSVGAAMAAGLAAGLEPDEILNRTEETFLRNRALRRITVPIYSLLDHQAFDRALQRHYGERRMEDLPINSFAVSSNLTDRRIHIHRTGFQWEAVRASTAIPGILPPFITRNGDVLVDGALVDNVPVDVMRNLKLGPNVVVLFKQIGDWRMTRGYSELPSRGALIRHLLLRRRTMDYPTLVSIIMRGMFLTSENIKRMSHPGDLFVTPGMPTDVKLLDWRRGRELAAAAHLHMKELLLTEAGQAWVPSHAPQM
jgi:NTE family protein